MGLLTPPPREPLRPAQVPVDELEPLSAYERASLMMKNAEAQRLYAIELRVFDMQHRPVMRYGQGTWISTIIIALLLYGVMVFFLGLLLAPVVLGR